MTQATPMYLWMVVITYAMVLITGAFFLCVSLWVFLQLFKLLRLPKLLGEIIREVISTVRR